MTELEVLIEAEVGAAVAQAPPPESMAQLHDRHQKRVRRNRRAAGVMLSIGAIVGMFLLVRAKESTTGLNTAASTSSQPLLPGSSAVPLESELTLFCEQGANIFRMSTLPIGMRLMSRQMNDLREAAEQLDIDDRATVFEAIDGVEESLAAARRDEAVDGYSTQAVVALVAQLCDLDNLMSFTVQPQGDT